MTAAVVVINADYMAISHTRLNRAMAMVVSGRAVIEEALPDKFIRHKNGQFPWPKIIRLLKYVKVPIRYGDETWSRQGVLRRDKHKCVFCGKAKNLEWYMERAVCENCRGQLASGSATPAATAS